MEKLNMLTQLRQRADKVGALEQEVRDLKAQISEWGHTREAALYALLRHIVDRSPFVTNDGVVEWDAEDGRSPEEFDQAVLNALIYIDPRPDEDAPPEQPEDIDLRLLRQRMTTRARRLSEAASKPEPELRERVQDALQAIQEWETERVAQVHAERQVARGSQAA